MKKALIVVDMLNDFMRTGGALFCGDAALAIMPSAVERLRQARERGDMVIYLCDTHRTDDAEFQMFPPHCIAGTSGAEVVDELAPIEGEVVVPKRRYSGFFGTQLDLTLREAGVSELDLIGVCTNICVLYTAADARNLGYGVTVHRDAVASFDENAHHWALKEMEATLGCQVK